MGDGTDYLALAKSALDHVQAKRVALGGEYSLAQMIEEATLAVRIAHVEALQRLDGYVPLPFDDPEENCVHGVNVGSECETCDSICEKCGQDKWTTTCTVDDAADDIGACVHGGQDDGCIGCEIVGNTGEHPEKFNDDCVYCIDDDTRESHAAFENAIASGRLERIRYASDGISPNPKWAADFMFMGRHECKDLFKHRDTRQYID